MQITVSLDTDDTVAMAWLCDYLNRNARPVMQSAAMQMEAQSGNPQYVGEQTAGRSGLTVETVDVGSQTLDVPVGRRRRRTAAEMEAARAADPTAAGSAAPTDALPPSENTAGSTEGSRRRRTVAPAPDPMPINDAEMSKAASGAAEALVNLGEDGPGIVKLVLDDYGVKSVGDVPQDRRCAFVEELQKEIAMAKAEKAAA